MTAQLTYAMEHRNPRQEWALGFLFEASGVAAAPYEPGAPDAVAVSYGAPPAGTRPAIVIPHRPGDRHWPELFAGAAQPPDLDRELPVDIVAVIGALLEDTVHDDLGPESLDDHGRLRSDASFSARLGLAQVPLVNVYVRHFAELLRLRLGIEGASAWPDGRTAAVVISHDVDLPDRYALLAGLARPWRFRRAPRTTTMAAIGLWRDRRADPQPDDHWAFDELMAAEDAAGVRSTFLFSVVPYYGRWGSTLDPAYDASAPRFRQLFRRLLEGGWEIGLHAGYRAHEQPGRLAAERRDLELLCDAPVRGLRHHYWQLGPDVAATLREHEAAGFAYDASLAFNDDLGFRRAVALPFQPFDALHGRPLRTWQLPTSCMDGNLFYRKLSVSVAVEQVIEQIETVRRLGGMAVIDWHSHTSVASNRRFRDWGLAYGEILGWLAGQPDLWVTTLGDVASWMEQRRVRLAPSMAAA